MCAGHVAIILGSGEKKRIGTVALASTKYVEPELTDEEKALARPKLFWVNIILIVVAIVSLLFSGFAPAVVFMVFYVLATLINYPKVSDSKARVDAHAKSCLMMCSVLFAAGCFTGIMSGHRHDHRDGRTPWCPSSPTPWASSSPSSWASSVCPPPCCLTPTPSTTACCPCWPRPPRASASLGADVGRAAILGQMTIGFPVSPLTASTFLLVGLSGVDLGEHQKKTIPWAWAVSLVMVVVALITQRCGICHLSRYPIPDLTIIGKEVVP